jgi:hypothetical protein
MSTTAAVAQPFCTSVLRIGPSGDKATILKSALLSYFQQASDEPSNPELPNQMALKNKYFTANILLHELGHDLPNTNYDDDAALSLYKEDGVMLVFDALQCNPDIANGSSFDTLHDVHDPTAGDLLRLCVGISLGNCSATELRGTKDPEGEYSKRIMWCLDRGYEYAEVDLSADGQAAGHSERDKEGFARLIEAIQGTVWSSAVMKPRKTAAQQVEEAEAAAAKAKEESKTNGSSTPSEGDKGTTEIAYEPPSVDLLSTLSIPDPTAHLPTTPPTTPTVENVNDEYLDEPASEQEAQQRASQKTEEQAFSQLEGIMKEATRIRDMSLRSEHDNDEDRRKRAADAATLMMGLMDQMGLDDDDGEDDSD